MHFSTSAGNSEATWQSHYDRKFHTRVAQEAVNRMSSWRHAVLARLGERDWQADTEAALARAIAAAACAAAVAAVEEENRPGPSTLPAATRQRIRPLYADLPSDPSDSEEGEYEWTESDDDSESDEDYDPPSGSDDGDSSSGGGISDSGAGDDDEGSWHSSDNTDDGGSSGQDSGSEGGGDGDAGMADGGWAADAGGAQGIDAAADDSEDQDEPLWWLAEGEVVDLISLSLPTPTNSACAPAASVNSDGRAGSPSMPMG